MEPRKLRELTIDETKLFIQFNKCDDITDLYVQLLECPGNWIIKAIEKRFEILKLHVDKKVIIYLVFLGNGIIGSCIKFVDDIYDKCKSLSILNIDWKIFTRVIYPDGIPIL